MHCSAAKMLWDYNLSFRLCAALSVCGAQPLFCITAVKMSVIIANLFMGGYLSPCALSGFGIAGCSLYERVSMSACRKIVVYICFLFDNSYFASSDRFDADNI